jgi:hypothetical protein
LPEWAHRGYPAPMGDKITAFGETLPLQCPPSDASQEALDGVFRAVKANPPTPECFDSYAKLGTGTKPKWATDCGWASCSLFTTDLAIRKLQRVKKRFTHIAKLSIPADCGVHTAQDAHIHFWRAATYDMRTAVVEVKEI